VLVRDVSPVPHSQEGGVLAGIAAAVAASVVNDANRQLRQLPDTEFLAAVEYALRDLSAPVLDGSPEEAFSAARERIAHLFRARLLPYSIDENGITTWDGEPAVRQLAIAPRSRRSPIRGWRPPVSSSSRHAASFGSASSKTPPSR
jgi:hypothetical protein